jgi:hypothetical protein
VADGARYDPATGRVAVAVEAKAAAVAAGASGSAGDRGAVASRGVAGFRGAAGGLVAPGTPSTLAAPFVGGVADQSWRIGGATFGTGPNRAV